MTDFRLLAAKYLRKERGFKYISLLGKGSYGTVVQMYTENRGMVAVKIVDKKLANSLETTQWRELDHINILRLLEVDEHLPSCVIFVTDLMSMNLTKHIQDKRYREEPTAIDTNRRYLSEVLAGLCYLHNRNMCHLDLRADNVFLSFDNRVVLADFSGLCYCSQKKNFCPLPRCFRPPEMLKTKKKVWPRPIDLWSIGLLAAHMYFLKKFYKVTILQGNAGTAESAKGYAEVFRDHVSIMEAVRKYYPKSRVTPAFCREFSSFLSQFLQGNPKKRRTANEAMEHAFLRRDYSGPAFGTSSSNSDSDPSSSREIVSNDTTKLTASTTLSMTSSSSDYKDCLMSAEELLPPQGKPTRSWTLTRAIAKAKSRDQGTVVCARSNDKGRPCTQLGEEEAGPSGLNKTPFVRFPMGSEVTPPTSDSPGMSEAFYIMDENRQSMSMSSKESASQELLRLQNGMSPWKRLKHRFLWVRNMFGKKKQRHVRAN